MGNTSPACATGTNSAKEQIEMARDYFVDGLPMKEIAGQARNDVLRGAKDDEKNSTADKRAGLRSAAKLIAGTM